MDTYAHIDSEEGKGQKIQLHSNGTWEFMEDNDDIIEWTDKHKSPIIIGLITSILAGILVYYLIQRK